MVINSRDIALPGDEWEKRVYFHHTGYAGGATWTLAWQLHEADPTMVSQWHVHSTEYRYCLKVQCSFSLSRRLCTVHLIDSFGIILISDLISFIHSAFISEMKAEMGTFAIN